LAVDACEVRGCSDLHIQGARAVQKEQGGVSTPFHSRGNTIRYDKIRRAGAASVSGAFAPAGTAHSAAVPYCVRLKPHACPC
jgi:hypothetical protein